MLKRIHIAYKWYSFNRLIYKKFSEASFIYNSIIVHQFSFRCAAPTKGTESRHIGRTHKQ